MHEQPSSNTASGLESIALSVPGVLVEQIAARVAELLHSQTRKQVDGQCELMVANACSSVGFPDSLHKPQTGVLRGRPDEQLVIAASNGVCWIWTVESPPPKAAAPLPAPWLRNRSSTRENEVDAA